MSAPPAPPRIYALFEHESTFDAGEISGAVRLGKLEAQYEELFAEAIEDGIITPEERAHLDRTAETLGLDRVRLQQLERALEVAYEARHQVRIREISAAEARLEGPPSSLGRALALSSLAEGGAGAGPTPAPAPDPRVPGLERRIRLLEARVAELERELEEAHAQAAVDVDFSGVAVAAASTDVTEDPEELHRRLRSDPHDADLLHALYRAAARGGDVDRQWCVAHALGFLGAAKEEEAQFYQERRVEGLIRPRAAMERESFRRFLFHPEAEPLTGEIFSVVLSPVLLGRLAALRRDKALPHLDPARLQDPRVCTLQAVRGFAWGAALLGMPSPPLYADPDFAGAVEIVPGVTPACRLGKQALHGRSPAELAFLAGHTLSYFRDDHFMRALLPSIPDLEDIFLAALNIGNPGLPLGGQVKARVAPIAQAIEPILERAQVDRLRAYFLRFVEEGGRTNLQRWAIAVDCTAARVGLLLADDLGAAQAMLAVTAPLHVQERVDDLLVFVTSDRYGKLRQKLGIAVAP